MQRSKKILLYKLCCALFAVVLLLVPHQRVPYSDLRVLVTVLGVDGNCGQVSVAAQLAVPVAQKSDAPGGTVAKAAGGSLSEALENLEIGLGRKMDYGHLCTVAIGQDVDIRALKEFTGYLLSSGKAGPGTYLVHCAENSAADFIDDIQTMGDSSDVELGSYVLFSKNGNHVSTTTLLRFLQTLNSTSNASFLPCVKLEDENKQPETGTGSGSEQKSASQQDKDSDKKEQSSKQKEDPSKQEESGGQSEKSQGGNGGEEQDESGGGQQGPGGGQNGKKLLVADKIAVFGGDSDTAVLLDKLTAKGIVWQDEHSDFGLVELRNVRLDGADIPSVSARLTSKKVKVTAKMHGGEHVVTYRIKFKLRLDDAQICGNPAFYTKWKKAFESAFENSVQNSILRTVAASKESNIDFLGLREYFHKFCQKGFASFDLQNVIVRVKAEATIQT